MAPKIEPKKVIIVEPEPEFNPPTETPAEIEARKRAEREAEQEESDNAWKKIPYVDKKHLQAGYYAGLEMERLWKPWQMGGHLHDFYKATRLSRPDDIAKHYEFEELLKRHDKLVFEMENWRRREFLMDDMKIHTSKLRKVEELRAKFQKLRKQIREEQLHYESSLRWPLSPHAPRLKDSSEDDESDYYAAAESEATEFTPPDSDAASSSDAGSSTPRKKNKREARRIRYSLFHYDLPRHVTPPTPSTRSTTPDAPKEYSFPVTVRTPAYNVGKARKMSELAQEVINLDAWEEKHSLGGGGDKAPAPAAKKK